MKRVQVVYAGWRATEIGEFEVGKNDTVKELSLKIQDAAGVPPQYQEFSFAGHRLEEDEVIVEAVAKHQSRSSDNDGGQGWFAWLRPARTTSQYVQSTAPPRNARKDGLAMEEDVVVLQLAYHGLAGGCCSNDICCDACCCYCVCRDCECYQRLCCFFHGCDCKCECLVRICCCLSGVDYQCNMCQCLCWRCYCCPTGDQRERALESQDLVSS
mmetsp:Transcript_14823/g.42176  ORF Transcript_14823/g.42176 Transcript_14823/m.42176 type:complete len:213 (+) Transcript_14823:31-669(+)